MSETETPTFAATPPYHRWPSNEDIDRHPHSDRCLACQVRRWSVDPEVIARAQGPCPMALTPVPGHIKESTGRFCSREGQLAVGGRCPDGCDHAEHYANDGHPECEDTSGEPR